MKLLNDFKTKLYQFFDDVTKISYSFSKLTSTSDYDNPLYQMQDRLNDMSNELRQIKDELNELTRAVREPLND